MKKLWLKQGFRGFFIKDLKAKGLWVKKLRAKMRLNLKSRV